MDERTQALKERVERATQGAPWTARRRSSAIVRGIAADIRALKNDPSGLEAYAVALETDHVILADLGTVNPDTEAVRTAEQQAEDKVERDRQAALKKIADDKLAADKAAGRA